MGGIGSGTRWDKKGTIEDHQRLDVRELHREHGIKPGDRMTVKYEWRGEMVTQEVMIDWTACSFGGKRPWFLCGNCGRRVAVLYGPGKIFACRHCLNLTYRSSQESDSRYSKFLRNYDGSGGVENMPLWALKGFLNQSCRERKRLKNKLNRGRPGRPQKMAEGPQ